jgi:hypothetical protein
MPTNDRAIAIYHKRLLSLTGIKTNWLQFLKDEITEVSAAIFQGQSGVLDQDEIELTSSANDTFDLDLTNAFRVLVGGGQIINLSLITGTGITSAIPFENTIGVTYSVGIKFAEVEDGVEANPSTGDPEYPNLKQTYGEIDFPDSVVDNTTYIRLIINSITGASEDHSGRTCRVWLVDPVSLVEGPAATAAYFEGTVGYSSPNNYVDIPYSGAAGPLGQDTGSAPPSTTNTDYKVFIEGTSWRNKANKDLSTDSDYAFIGEIAGNGPGAIPVAFDISGQIPIFINSLDRAYDGPSGAGSGRQVFVDSEAIELRSRTGSGDELGATLRIDRKGGTEVGGVCFQTIADEALDGTEANVQHFMPLAHSVGGLAVDMPGADSTAVDIITRGGAEDFVVSNVHLRCDYAWLQGFSTIDGLYTLFAVTASTLQLRNLDGTVPNFPINDGPGTLTILRAVQSVTALKFGSVSNPQINGKAGTAFLGTNEGATPSGDGGDDLMAATVFYGDEVDALHAYEQYEAAPKVITWINKAGYIKTITGMYIAPSNVPQQQPLGLVLASGGVNGLAALGYVPIGGQTLGFIGTPANDLARVMECSGRIAQPHRFYDDFQYHQTKWNSLVTAPQYYEATATGSGIVFQSAGGGVGHGGHALLRATAAGIESATLQGDRHWWLDTDTDIRLFYFDRMAFNYDVTNDRIERHGLTDISVGNWSISFEHDNTAHGNNNWWLVVKDGTNPTEKVDTGIPFANYDGANNPIYRNFYFFVTGDQSIVYWVDGMGAEATLNLSTITFSAAGVAMGVEAYEYNGDASQRESYLDYWEVRDNVALSGDIGAQAY